MDKYKDKLKQGKLSALTRIGRRVGEIVSTPEEG